MVWQAEDTNVVHFVISCELLAGQSSKMLMVSWWLEDIGRGGEITVILGPKLSRNSAVIGLGRVGETIFTYAQKTTGECCPYPEMPTIFRDFGG